MRQLLSVLAATALLAGCSGGGSSNAPLTPPAPVSNLSAAAQLGQKIFSDASLSASGRQSCASCHAPDHAFGPVNDLSAQPGGPNLDTPGFRAVPSLRYMEKTPAFFFAADGTPTGGFDRDGRAQSLA